MQGARCGGAVRSLLRLLPAVALGGACQADSEPVDLVPATLESEATRACAAPATRDDAPLVLSRGAPRSADPVYRAHGAGSVIADLNGDGWLDILVMTEEGVERYDAVDRPGNFARNREIWIDDDPDLTSAFGGAAADYDDDGDVDVFVTRYGRPNRLLQNHGDGQFVDVAGAVGVVGPAEGRHSSATWEDFDQDGDLDLIVAGHGLVPEDGTPVTEFGPGEPSEVFRNDGDSFTDISAILPDEVHDAYTFTHTLLDLDRDGDLDWYVANDFGRRIQACQLLWNEDGEFRVDDGSAGLNLAISAMGTGVGDVNHDGRWDLVLPAWGSIAYMISNPDRGRWFNFADAAGLVPNSAVAQTVGWGVELADLDNDGDLDAPVVFGYIETATGRNRENQPNGLWLQAVTGELVQAAPEWGFDHRGSGRGLAVGDLNEDGYLDLVVPDLGGPALLYQSACGDRASLKVRLRQPAPNRDAIGARVSVTLAGRRLLRRVFAGGTSLASSGPPEVHFGLGSARHVDAVEITWPDGAQSRFEDVAVNQTVHIERTESP